MTLTSANRRAVVAACADMITACGLTLGEIADHLGVPLEASVGRCDALTARVKEVLRRIDNPDGASIQEVMDSMGLRIQTVSGYVGQLERLGCIVRVSAPGVRAPRCFTDPAAAARWVEAHAEAAERDRQDEKARAEALAAERKRQAEQREAIKAQRRQEQPQRQAEKRQQAAARAAAKVTPSPMPNAGVVLQNHGRPQMRGTAVETEATRRTIDGTKRPNNRIDAAPALPPDPRWPSFAAVGLGIDPATGRPWEERA